MIKDERFEAAKRRFVAHEIDEDAMILERLDHLMRLHEEVTAELITEVGALRDVVTKRIALGSRLIKVSQYRGPA